MEIPRSRIRIGRMDDVLAVVSHWNTAAAQLDFSKLSNASAKIISLSASVARVAQSEEFQQAVDELGLEVAHMDEPWQLQAVGQHLPSPLALVEIVQPDILEPSDVDRLAQSLYSVVRQTRPAVTGLTIYSHLENPLGTVVPRLGQ